jgi:2'-5' RNA ligase
MKLKQEDFNNITMKRIFIAVKVHPDENFRSEVSMIRSALSGEKIKWTDENNIHITLVFLGDTVEDVIPAIGQMLNERCRDYGSFNLKLKGFGVFKNIRDPHVIWAGLAQSEKLAGLNRTITIGLNNMGIQTEDRHFSPHLTLGRMKIINDRDRLKSLIDFHREDDIQDVPVTEVVLYESILGQTGPQYKPIFTANL